MDVINKWDVISAQCKLLKMEERNYLRMDSYKDIKSYIYPIPDVNGAIRYRPNVHPFFDEMGNEPDKYFEIQMVDLEFFDEDENDSETPEISKCIDVMFGIINHGNYVIKKTIHIDAGYQIPHGFIVKKFAELINEIDNSTLRSYYKNILLEIN